MGGRATVLEKKEGLQQPPPAANAARTTYEKAMHGHTYLC
jgi:hypothetical protein